MKTEQKENHSEQQAIAQLSGIMEMVEALRSAEASGDDSAIESAREAIQNEPLSVEVRSGWHTLDVYAEECKTPMEFTILLCTGGPAVRIIGELENEEPENVHIQHQDWGTQWEGIVMTGEQGDMVKEYCRCFYFGE